MNDDKKKIILQKLNKIESENIDDELSNEAAKKASSLVTSINKLDGIKTKSIADGYEAKKVYEKFKRGE